MYVCTCVLQCLRVMQRVAVCCRYVWNNSRHLCVAVCCSVLQCVAVRCVQCSVLQCVADTYATSHITSVLQCVAVCCSVLRVWQCVAVFCRYIWNTLLNSCLMSHNARTNAFCRRYISKKTIYTLNSGLMSLVTRTNALRRTYIYI